MFQAFSHFQLPVVVADMPLDSALPRCVLRGSLDPTTGMFYRAPERARIRTPQACDKCRIRKAKVTSQYSISTSHYLHSVLIHYFPNSVVVTIPYANDVVSAGWLVIMPLSVAHLGPGEVRQCRIGAAAKLHRPMRRPPAPRVARTDHRLAASM